jgi:kynurenine formamidase
MKVIDLSHTINPDVTIFPGMEQPVFEEIDIEGYKELKITMYTHTATHIDVPCHIIKGTKSLNDLTADWFVGRGVVIDCKGLPEGGITLDFLKKHEQKIKNAEFILLNSGWSKKWKTDGYLSGFPTLTAEASEWLTKFKLKGIGLDSISLDPVPDMTLPNHKIVLKHDIIIVENMTNMDAIPEGDFIFQCLPLKIDKADGSPVRAVAIVGLA